MSWSLQSDPLSTAYEIGPRLVRQHPVDGVNIGSSDGLVPDANVDSICVATWNH